MHHIPLEHVFLELNTGPQGLSEEEAKKRYELYGPNRFAEGEESKWRILLRQFINSFIIILMIAGFVAFFFGDMIDAVVVYALILINGFVGFYQELKAIASIKALKSMSEPKVRGIRDGEETEIDIKDLVPGDVVILSEGDIVPADVRLVKATGVLVDETLLTGESLPVEKVSEAVLPENTPLHLRYNCLYKGTTVIRGRGVGVVFATGENTELGKIAKRMKEKSPESPLTKALGSFGKKWVAILVMILSSLVLIGILQGRKIQTLMFFAVAQLVSAVPEGLPIVVTIALVVGAMRLSREKVLVKYLPAVETLGSATYICSDKTGTITEGRLSVYRYHAYDKKRLLLASALCNDATVNKGDPLEVALLEWLERERVNWAVLREAYRRVWEHPFDAKLRLMAVVVSDGNSLELYVKGAFESLEKLCKELHESAKEVHDNLAEEGLRVIAFGYARLEEVPGDIEEVKVELVGFVGFLDPPKEGVREAVEQARYAGIKVIMITGDNLLTAKAVARMVGIYQEGDIAIEGKDIEKYSDQELYQLLKRVSVVARATPEDKYRIVKVLQSKGEVVAVTGDGANDAPALRVADLGIAMGSGSQSAKEASKMIILDNNLAIIVNAIRRGRLIAKNISKVIRYLLSTNAFEIIYNSLAIISELPLPLYATQILWINLVTDGVQDKAYPFTKYEGNPMKEKPKHPAQVFIGREQFIKVAYNGLVMGFSHYLIFTYLLKLYTYEVALTISFTSAVLSQLSVGIQEIGERPFLKNPIEYIKLNPYIYLGISIGMLLHLLAIGFIPYYFHAVRLSMEHIPYVFIIPTLTFFAIELRKCLFR
ncbi:MAG: cation-transporting P-type ATPase [Hydrogenobacter sp.]|uniref:cation-translocating P-type ATPase n=1 Tax=Hydrogenobacter thermophilus TaxID=940 RepID=UPI0030F4F04B